MDDTRDSAYTERLQRLQGARWKSALGAQLPYRWNIRRLFATQHSVLDVGCGVGRNLAHLSGQLHAVGVDHNATSVAVARSAGLTAYASADWPQSPDAVPGTFDGLLVAHVLEHLDSDVADEVIDSYLPFLTPNARLVLICPQERGYATDATHVRFLDFADLADSARRWGFTPVRQLSFPFSRATGTRFPYNEFVLVAERHATAS